jgi:hypothetical protein
MHPGFRMKKNICIKLNENGRTKFARYKWEQRGVWRVSGCKNDVYVPA